MVESRSQQSPPRRSRRWTFRLLAILLGLTPFLLLEVGLRLFNVGATNAGDPLVGFSELHPLFDKHASEGVYRTALARELFFGVQEFQVEKPDNGFRVFCLGGSTVRGRPYQTDTAFAKWLQIELATCDPTHEYEVVNCGGLSYASYRLRVMLEEVLRYKPDLIVVATGHNEFLEDRTYESLKSRSRLRAWAEDRANQLRIVTTTKQLLGKATPTTKTASGKTVLGDEVKARLDDDGGYGTYHRDDAWQAGVSSHFDLSVRAMVKQCQDAGVPLILVRLGSNIRDTAPFKSEHKPDLSLEDETQWQLLFDKATSYDIDQPEEALKLYQKAAQIDDEFALLSFRIARILDRQKKYLEAKQYYLKAKDDDVCPLRMLEDMSTNFADIATETNTPWVDAHGLLEELTPNQIAGNDVYTDHVHPTIYGHQVIAQAIAETMRERELTTSSSEWSDQQRHDTYQDHIESLGINYWVDAQERVSWLESWARRNRLLAEILPADEQGFLRRAMRMANFGRNDDATQDFEAALKDESLTVALNRYTWELYDQGRVLTSNQLLQWLRSLPEMKEYYREMDVGLLVTSVRLEDVDAVASMLEASDSDWEDLTSEESAWTKAVPDVLARARTMTSH